MLTGAEDFRPWTDIWPIRLDEVLPTVPIPLLSGDPDIPLDLQAAFTGVYDLLRYDLAVDYTAPPDVAMGGDMAAWADDLLRDAGPKS